MKPRPVARSYFRTSPFTVVPSKHCPRRSGPPIIPVLPLRLRNLSGLRCSRLKMFANGDPNKCSHRQILSLGARRYLIEVGTVQVQCGRSQHNCSATAPAIKVEKVIFPVLNVCTCSEIADNPQASPLRKSQRMPPQKWCPREDRGAGRHNREPNHCSFPVPPTPASRVVASESSRK